MSEEESPPAKTPLQFESWSWAQNVQFYLDVPSNRRVKNPPFVYDKNVEYKYGCFKYGDKILSGPVPVSAPVLDLPPSVSNGHQRAPKGQGIASEQEEDESDSECSDDDLPYKAEIDEEEWKRDCEDAELWRKEQEQAMRNEIAKQEELLAKKRRLETSVPYPSYHPRAGNYKYQVWYKKGAPDGFQLDPAFEICKIDNNADSASHKRVKSDLKHLPVWFQLDPTFKAYKINNDDDSASHRMMKFALTLLPLMGIEISGESETVFHEHFILTRVGIDNMEVDDIFFRRCVERSVQHDPPLLLEIMEQFYFYSEKKGQKHPIAQFYPPSYTYEMIEYCEDRYWTEHQGELPGRLKYPQKRVTWVVDPPTPAEWKEIMDIKYSFIQPGGEMFVLNFAETKQELKCCVGFGLELAGCSEKTVEVGKPNIE
ncbi:hypothetical protein CRE_19152 [Caenorhabditis remanei]|uniref:Uncharacterized protein n=1 Tax=Caenorhabditis remanei TaxID=31234 RepID=E3MJK7_CAERE|nr:hypothetical protein CRE_19152 [Caenorhabditis remanei]